MTGTRQKNRPQGTITTTAKEVLRGITTVVVPRALLRRETGGTTMARPCHLVFLRHLVMIGRHGGSTGPARVAEIGPRDSLGVGRASLRAGVVRPLRFR